MHATNGTTAAPGASRDTNRPAAWRRAASLDGTLPAVTLALTALMALVSMACAPQPVPSQAPQPTPTASRSAVTPAPATPPGGVPAAALAAAQKDLAARLKVPETEIRVVRAEPVDWPDTSLGCPKAGMSYAQVITPGFRLVLAAGQATYEYHSNMAGDVVTCG